MVKKTQRIGLLFLAGALVSLILLAASLSNLQLHSGAPFPSGGGAANPAGSVQVAPPVKSYSLPILQGICALIFLFLMVYVPIRMIMLADRKIILRLALAMVVLLAIVYMLPRIPLDQPAYVPDGAAEITTPPSFDYSVTPLGRPPQALIWLVILGILSGMSLVAIKIMKQWLRPTRVEDELLEEAEDAVSALKAGVDLRNVIIRCYLQMTRSLQEAKGIERNTTMTVREFEDWLEVIGFPTSPVHQLTNLFEKVRYGEQPMNKNDEQIAMESLNVIIQFCRSERD